MDDSTIQLSGVVNHPTQFSIMLLAQADKIMIKRFFIRSS